MSTLKDDVLGWLKRTGYRQASFARLMEKIPTVNSTYDLRRMVADDRDTFRDIRLKGGLAGLALQEDFEFPKDEVVSAAGTVTLDPFVISPTTQVLNEIAAAIPEVPAPVVVETEVVQPILDEAPTVDDGIPRVTETDLKNEITGVYYINPQDALHAIDRRQKRGMRELPVSMSLLTICILTLKNGYTVTGKSACVSPALYNKDLGQELAYKNAVQHMWPLMGFRLADKLNSPEAQR